MKKLTESRNLQGLRMGQKLSPIKNTVNLQSNYGMLM